MKKLLIVFLSLIVLSVVSAQDVDPVVNTIKQVTPMQTTLGVYEKQELVADIDAAFNNPYDPDDIRVDGQFTSPSGSVMTVPGFYYQDFSDDAGNLTASDNWSWRVRFTPTEVGDWQYQVMATTAKGTTSSDVGTFTVTPSDHPGFVRVDSRNPRYFVFDNGAPYYPIGENMAWATGNPLTDYPKWLDGLHAAGGNFIRVWMASWGFGVEWLDTGLGNYDKRQMQAYQLDQLMDMAADRNIYIMLSLLNHGAFNTTTDAEWNQNPYNAANGGPCADPTCFGTDPAAIELWHQRLRYIAARWGYSPNIMSWEWWNEINWTGLVNPNILEPWVKQSADYLGSLDPYRHLITHSGSPEGDKGLWGQDSIAFTQNHLYNLTNLPLSFNREIQQWLKDYPTKPFLMGEFGTAGTQSATDTAGITLHLGIWSAPMNGAAGSAMTWWWDSYVDPLNLYSQFTGLSAFLQGEDLAAQQWQATSAGFAAQTKAHVYGLQSDDAALLWVVNGDYNEHFVQDANAQAQRAQNNEPAIYSFEGDSNGWALIKDWAAGKSAAIATDQSTDGTSSLALSATYTGGGTWQEAGAGVQLEKVADWSKYATVSLDIYVPADATDFIAQVYTKTGDAVSWTNSPDISLIPGQWNPVTVPLSALGDVTSIHEFGLKIGSSSAVFDGTFNIDNISLSTDQPTTNVTVDVPFPTIEGSSLVVKDLKAGSYTIEFWDTIKGTVESTAAAESTDGTLQIALPTFNTDLAIKIKPQ